MENVNPFCPPVPPNVPRDHIVQKLDELLKISAMIDSRLENIDHNQIMIPPPALPEQLLNDFFDPPDFLEIDDLGSDVESVDTPLVCPFIDLDDQKMHWMAFGGKTRDLCSIGEKKGQDYNSTPKSLEEFRTVPGDGVAIPSDDVISYKRRRQDF
ncbi:hypothetical protein Tco_1164996 [Tanacetum coccineum]